MFEDENGIMLVQDDYFMHVIHAETVDREPNKRLVFLLDRSGSMRQAINQNGNPSLSIFGSLFGSSTDNYMYAAKKALKG